MYGYSGSLVAGIYWTIIYEDEDEEVE